MKKTLTLAAFSLSLVAATASAQDPDGIGADVNIGHLAPFAPVLADTAVSIDVNGSEAVTGVQFGDFTGYVPLTGMTDPFDVDVDVRTPPGGDVAISATLPLDSGTDYTVVAIGNVVNQPLELFPLVDSVPVRGETDVALRIVHAAPFASDLTATEVDIRTDSGDVVAGLTNVPYKGNSGFFNVPAGTYDLQVTTPGGALTLIDLAPVDLPAGARVTVFAVGDLVNQPVGAIAAFGDGTFAALPLEAPDAMPIPTLGQWGLILMVLGLAVVGIRRLV
jgi:hypothetical protein